MDVLDDPCSSRGDNTVEIGTNWIHGTSKENPVFRLACDYQLLDKESMSEENQAIDVGVNSSMMEVENLYRALGSLSRQRLNVMINTLLKLECCVSGTHTMDDVGLGAFGMYKTLPGLDCTFPGDYEGLIDHMMKELPKDIVLYNKPVKCIHWNYTKSEPKTTGTRFPVMIECVNGETFAADHVIVTTPLV
ncbi:peroxisomal N(1)-acetyl-spermine/spermidine oxidase-like [Puntigrus tetrazona]|uniref:peroxisomal N(1)-acetyl-spermine/spermidine oxidase-like n=1 Tax=Puntigrus tetrazona TaxID=1606681 RepID=UPI001C89FE1F|nr:peroxisomal N(1)-acetyl-spermine/spermidine oxidase-like [Puntigrus tetrazona]